jgi:hypothetical protein
MVISTRRADLLHFVFGRPVESTADFCLSSPAENGQEQSLDKRTPGIENELTFNQRLKEEKCNRYSIG